MKKTKTITGIRLLVIKAFTLLLMMSFGSGNIWAMTCPCTSPVFPSVMTEYVMGGISEGIATGDFNNDSKLDLITAGRFTNVITIRFGNGAGGFDTTTSFSLPANVNTPFAVVVADFNQDGNFDFATSNRGSNNISVGYGNGSGSFPLISVLTTNDPTNQASPYRLTTGDFNHDGKLDIAVCNDSSVSVFDNLGSLFSKRENYLYPNAGFHSIKSGDFNSDGWDDLVVSTNSASTVQPLYFLLNDHLLGWTLNRPDLTNEGGSGGVVAMVAGDFDADGFKDDLVVGSRNFAYGELRAYRVSSTVPTITMTFEANVQTGFDYGGGISAGDFNADGKLDFAFALGYPAPGVGFYFGRGNGQFDYISGSAPTTGTSGDSAVGDFNSDGKLDVVFAVYPGDGTRAGILLNTYNQNAIRKTDYNGDGRTDFAYWTPSTGNWNIRYSYFNTNTTTQFGANGDIPVQGDYDGDKKTDTAVFRPSDSTWYILKSQDGFSALHWGTSGDKLVPGDYDGDCKTDIAVFRPSDSTWYIYKSSNGGLLAVQFGTTGDIPIQGDYDGDGKTDVAVFRPSNSTWYILRSQSGFLSVVWGTTDDKPVPGDYDGDCKTDFAVFRPSNSTWYILKSSDSNWFAFQFGSSTDAPQVGDYDGDGKTDAAMWKSSTGTWSVRRSSDLGLTSLNFGTVGDIPTASAYPIQ